MLNCIHYHFSNPCGKPAVTRVSHGWLCDGHFKQQQRSIPAKARKAQPVWRGALTDDNAIIADVIAQDKRAIREGNIVRVVRGALEPVVLRLLEPPTVH